MKDQTRRLLKRCLVWLLTLALLSGTVCFGEMTGKAEQDESKALYIGFNAGNETESIPKTYHEQAVALMKLVLMMEERDNPAVNITYLAGTTDKNNVGIPLEFSWDDMGALNAKNEAKKMAANTFGMDLLNYLKNVVGKNDSGKRTIYWFDRLNTKSVEGDIKEALNTVLTNDQTEVFIAFPDDSYAQEFQTKVVGELGQKGNRVHVFSYAGKSLEESLRHLNNQDIGALYNGELTGTSETDPSNGQTFVYSLPDSAGNRTMLLIHSQREITGIRADDSDLLNNSIKYGEETFVFLPANRTAEKLRLQVASDAAGAPSVENTPPVESAAAAESTLPAASTSTETGAQIEISAPAVSYYLLPTWKGQAKVMLEEGTEKLELFPEKKELDVSAVLPGLDQSNVRIKAEVTYSRLDQKTDPVYADIYTPPESTPPADETAVSDDASFAGVFVVDDTEGSAEPGVTDVQAGDDAAGTQDESAAVNTAGTQNESAAANTAGTQGEALAEKAAEVTGSTKQKLFNINSEKLSEPSADGSLAWRVTIPALKIGEGQLVFSVELAKPGKSILKREDLAVLAQTTPVEFQMTNRNPSAVENVKTEYDVFHDVPGEENVPLRVDLSKIFTETDAGQALQYFLREGDANYLQSGPFKVQDNWLEIAPENEKDTAEVTVRACDPYGGYADITLTAHWFSVSTILEELRFQNPETSEGIVGRPTELTWSLSDSGLASYEKAKTAYPPTQPNAQYPGLPNLEDALQVTGSQEDVTFIGIEAENGVPVLRAVIAASQEDKEVSVLPEVSFKHKDEEFQLKNLFSGKWTVSTDNTAPCIRQGVDEERKTTEVSDYIKDYPVLLPNEPMNVPVAGEKVVTLSALFIDIDTENDGLYYFIVTDSQDIALKIDGLDIPETKDHDSVVPKPENGKLWELKPEDQASEKTLELLMTKPGKANVTIRAWDEAELSEAVTINAEAKSSFGRSLLIAGIALAVLLVLFGVFEFFYQRSRPSFRQVTMDITHVPYASIHGHLDLSYYGKNNVNFLTLMTAAGMPPQEEISSETLSGIELKPLRANCFRIVMNNNAEKQVKVDFDGVKPDKDHTFTFQQKVSILSVTKEEGITILLSRETKGEKTGEQ